MRLLFLTETIPFPLDSGGRIKTFNTIRILSREHEVHCHALVRDPRHLRFESDLARHVASLSLHLVPRSIVGEIGALVSSQISGVPFVVRRHFHPDLLQRLGHESSRGQFDAVYCDHLSMLEYGRRLRLPIVLDAHNVEYQIVQRHAATLGISPRRVFAELEWRRLERYEKRWYRDCALIFVVSGVDERAIRALSGDRPRIAVVPIAIDAKATAWVQTLVSGPEILFVGGLHWPPNADAVTYFIREIFPIIRHTVPAARFTVVGRNFEPIARQCGACEGVRFAGHVADVEPFFQSSRVMVVPIRSGSGMRVKILDGLARGVPIVATTIGCEGIEAVAGRHLLVADEPAEFAASVLRILADDGLAGSLAAAGQLLVAETYDTRVVARDILDAVRSLLPLSPLHAQQPGS